jgi:molybdopterin/thiamine biosynthesis adenylyltransferase
MLEAALRQMLQGDDVMMAGRAGINRPPRLAEYICRELRLSALTTLPLASPAVVLMWGRESQNPVGHQLRLPGWLREPANPGPLAILTLEQHPMRGRLDAVLRSSSGQIEPIHAIKIIGAGMHVETTPSAESVFPNIVLTPTDLEKWSRTIGFLGEDAWRRLRSLRYAVVGLGRTGSLVATSLIRWGVQRLTLIDADRLELHNIDSMDGVTDRDVGRLKVSTLRDFLLNIGTRNAEITTVGESITTLRAFAEAKAADFLICSVDDDGARLATAIIAALYCKPLLELGTGVFIEARNRRMGGDIRLILPGERCLLCFGGISNLDAARSIFSRQGRAAPIPWHQQRAGSSRALNQVVSHLGLLQIQELITERLEQSRWLHLEVDSNGLPTIQSIDPPVFSACPLCRRFGEGDEGLSRVRDLQSALARSTTDIQAEHT